MDAAYKTGWQMATQLVRIGVVATVTYYCAKWLLNSMDPTSSAKQNARRIAKKQLKKLNAILGDADKFKMADFNTHELMIASHLVAPTDIEVGWDDIAGLDSVVQELRESIVLPMRHMDLFQHSKLWRPPKGVLLYGPPGCGKTLIAKAIAREGGMRFINLDVALLTDKWYGESQKLAAAVFTLAEKVQPCIIFIDEIESFLRIRAAGDHEATAMMKTQFMTLWDGLLSNSNCTVMLLGATNRPQDLDKAILRRMPAQFYIKPPVEMERIDILNVILRNEKLNESVDLRKVASLTNDYSGSDLSELCRLASINHLRSLLPKDKRNTMYHEINENELVISMNDFLKALVTFKVARLSPYSITKLKSVQDE